MNGLIPIDAGYRSPEIEIIYFCMLPFANSPGDQRVWMIEMTTRSVVGKDLYKIDRSVVRTLVNIKPHTAKRCNEIVEKQFKIHRIEERMNAVDNLTQI